MPNTAEKLMSLDEFLVWEREQPERYEYADGVVTMMTGGSAAHVTIALKPCHGPEASAPRHRMSSVRQRHEGNCQ
jgi:hypothetical protein